MHSIQASHMANNGIIVYRVTNLHIPTSIAPATLQRASGGQLPCGGQPTLSHWVAERWAARCASGGPPEASHLCAYSFIPWPSSVPPDFMLDGFWPPIAKLMPPLWFHQWHSLALQPSASGWLVEACLLWAEPPHCYQGPTGGTLNVIRRPP